MKFQFVPTLFLAAFVALPSRLRSDDMAILKDRLHKAATDTALDAPDMKPWHVTMSFDIMDAKGQPKQTGTIEELWSSPSLHKLTYVNGSATWTKIVNQEGTFQSTGMQEPPELATLLLREIVHPFPPISVVDAGVLALKKTQLGTVSLDCISLGRSPDAQAKPVPSALIPVYCLDHDKTSLRVTSRYNMENFTRMTIGTYAGKSVVIDQAISFYGTLAAKAHLVKLKSESFSDADFVADPTMTITGETPVDLPAQNMAANPIKKVPPIYPESAKSSHTSGTVLLHAIIGKDGYVASLSPIYSPSSDLTEASIKAVRQWIYEPYTVNGTAYPVDTEIAINFSFGPSY